MLTFRTKFGVIDYGPCSGTENLITVCEGNKVVIILIFGRPFCIRFIKPNMYLIMEVVKK